MIESVPLDSIVSNPFNVRIEYFAKDIDSLALSLKIIGQLEPVKVRPSPSQPGQFELVYGHRRVLAAKKLDWKTITAEITSADDEAMLEQSLVENVERRDLCDYEKALAFENLSVHFGKTYEEIGRLAGMSKSHVCNFLSMLRLFRPGRVSEDPSLAEVLRRLSEHHARILLTVDDEATRIDLAKRVVKDGLSVRELSNILIRLRSWFDDAEGDNERNAASQTSSGNQDIREISRRILDEFESAQNGDFARYKRTRLLGDSFRLFSAFPPLSKSDATHAVRRESEWRSKFAPNLRWKIEDLKIELLGKAALATFFVFYYAPKPESNEISLRATMVFIKKHDEWKIMHEHYSQINDEIRALRL